MKPIFFAAATPLLLVGCDFTGTTGTSGTLTNTIPSELAGDLKSISYNGSTTLTVDVSSLDIGDRTVSYVRNPAMDVPGYIGFSVQDDPLDRMFVALVAVSNSGDLQAGVVADGGQFNRYFRGGFYNRTSSANLPTTGQVSYAGNYAGITNIASTGGNLLPVAPGTPTDTLPGEPARTQGTVFLNVNFDDNSVNGTIYNRDFVDAALAATGSLESLALTPAQIDSNGEFLGTVEFSGLPNEGKQGSYGGIFGGPGGRDEVAGIIYLTNIFLSTDARDTDFDSEVGVFVLPRCGTAGAPAICSQVN